MDQEKQTESQSSGAVGGNPSNSTNAAPAPAPAPQSMTATQQVTTPEVTETLQAPQVTQAPFGHIMTESEVQSFESSTNLSSKTAMWSNPADASEVSDRPMPVVKVLSVKGLEYLFMSFGLWFAAGSLIVILLMIINGVSSFSELSFPSALLIASLPVFVVFFLRLRKAENNDPSLTLDPSKRRMSQITQILAFVACFFNFTAFVYNVMRAIGGEEGVSILKSFLSLLVITVIAGGVLAYYWFNEHRSVN